MVAARHGNVDGWIPPVLRGAYGCGPWRGILKTLLVFCHGLAFEVSDDSRIRFWLDDWCGGRPLREDFPDIFSIVVDQGLLMALNMFIHDGVVVWHPRLRRAAFDWEILRLIELLTHLQGAWVLIGGEDRRVWKKNSGGSFTVRACYEHISGDRAFLGPWKEIWYKAIPFKVQFFMWTASLEKISTMNMLQRKGLVLPSVYLLYYQAAESVSYLLLHCPYSWEIWCGIAREFGTVYIAPSSLSYLLQGWNIPVFTPFGRKVWKLVPAVVCWEIWWEINNRAFRSYSKPAFQMFRRVRELILFWARRCNGYEGIPNKALLRDWDNITGCS